MKDARASLRYAKAILNLAKDSNAAEAVHSDMKHISETIANNDDLEVALKSPVIKVQDKLNVLNALFEANVHAITQGLFSLLAENKRIYMLVSIAKQYAVIYDFLRHMQVAKVTTAVPLTDALEAKVLDKIVALTGKNATLENEVNPSIIGGFILRVADVQYDASISNHLNQLKKEFDNSHYIPKI